MVDNVHYVKLIAGDAAASGLAGPVRVARRLDAPGGPGAGADRAADPGVQVVAAAHHERADHEVPDDPQHQVEHPDRERTHRCDLEDPVGDDVVQGVLLIGVLRLLA